MCENVNCVLIVSPLKLHCITFYPIENFQKHLAPEFLNIDIKRVITKVDETVTCKFNYGQAVVL